MVSMVFMAMVMRYRGRRMISVGIIITRRTQTNRKFLLLKSYMANP